MNGLPVSCSGGTHRTTACCACKQSISEVWTTSLSTGMFAGLLRRRISVCKRVVRLCVWRDISVCVWERERERERCICNVCDKHVWHAPSKACVWYDCLCLWWLLQSWKDHFFLLSHLQLNTSLKPSFSPTTLSSNLKTSLASYCTGGCVPARSLISYSWLEGSPQSHYTNTEQLNTNLITSRPRMKLAASWS